MKNLQQVIKLFELPQLTVNITPKNSTHVPSAGCYRLAYLEANDSITTRYSISLGTDEKIICQAVGNVLYQHELLKAMQKYQVNIERFE